jgi:hypothetical protein
MDSSKAKKAVQKSTARKEAQAAAAMELAAAMQAAQPIDPEIQSAEIDLQPADGYVTAYHRMGAIPPAAYAEYNRVMGPNMSGVINPVA